MVKNPPTNVRDTGLIPDLRRFHKEQLLSLFSRAQKLQLLKPTRRRACALQQEKPSQWEACALQLEKALTDSNKDPAQPKLNK